MYHIIPTAYKKWVITGTILTLLGSFLPWIQGGDFLSTYTSGIQISWRYGAYDYLTFDDNGGLLVVLLSLGIFLLIVRPPNFIQTPRLLSMICSIVLLLVALFHVARVFIVYVNATYIGAPVVWIGLWIVLAGSLLLVYITTMSYFKGQLAV